jgi:hypothetical protein
MQKKAASSLCNGNAGRDAQPGTCLYRFAWGVIFGWFGGKVKLNLLRDGTIFNRVEVKLLRCVRALPPRLTPLDGTRKREVEIAAPGARGFSHSAFRLVPGCAHGQVPRSN